MADGGLISIGLCADTHYWPHGQDFVTAEGSLQLQGSTPALLSALFNDLRNANLELVIHLGDLTCGGGTYAMSPEAYSAAVADLYRTYQALRLPVYILPGNHDSLPGSGGWSAFHAVWGLEPGLGMTLDVPHARLVLLNTHGHSPAQIAQAPEYDPVYGWVNDAELHRLEQSLATAGERPVLVFTHQLLAPWSDADGWQEFYGVQNAAAVQTVLARYGNVRAVFQAHAHRFDVRTRRLGGQECLFVVVPSLIEYPVAWVRLDLTRDQLRLRLQKLPLPELQEASRTSGGGQEWRAGRSEWQDFTIALQPSEE